MRAILLLVVSVITGCGATGTIEQWQRQIADPAEIQTPQSHLVEGPLYWLITKPRQVTAIPLGSIETEQGLLYPFAVGVQIEGVHYPLFPRYPKIIDVRLVVARRDDADVRWRMSEFSQAALNAYVGEGGAYQSFPKASDQWRLQSRDGMLLLVEGATDAEFVIKID